MKKIIILLMLLVLVSGCNPAARAQQWAERALSETWNAQYRVVFHQEDQDIEMVVHEFRGENLVLDINMPNGSLSLEYGQDFALNLDQGQLEWEDFPRQPPYYTLSELSQQVAAAEIASQGDWANVAGYSVRIEEELPVEIKWEDQWTLYVESFLWE